MSAIIRKYKIHQLTPTLSDIEYNEITSILEFYSSLVIEDKIYYGRRILYKIEDITMFMYSYDIKKLYIYIDRDFDNRNGYSKITRINRTDIEHIKLLAYIFAYKFNKKIDDVILKMTDDSYNSGNIAL